ncbi:MAG: LLM class flavin-dependent oxidoreductase [Egibacteraceae bacterium]
MRPPQFGVALPVGPDLPAFARHAEVLGFDYLCSGEHLMFHGPAANAFVALSVAAGATSRVRLVSTVTLVPLYPAVLLAKMTAALDVASAGRFSLGVGVGGEYPDEFAAAGVPVGERGARTDEALEVVDRLLTQERVTFSGTYTSLTDATIAPRPAQSPRPPIWVAGRSPAAVRRAARYGDVWMPYMYTPEQLAQSLVAVDDQARRAGRAGWQGRAAIFAFVAVYPDRAQARRVAVETVSQTYRQDFAPLADRYLIAGSPDDARRRIGEYLDAGADTVLLRLACPEDDAASMAQRLASEVVAPLRGSRGT